MKELLDQIQKNQEAAVPVSFSENRTINTILQDAAGRAKKAGIRFRAIVRVPNVLNIPETDLCSFLMNLLENALEASAEVLLPEGRFVFIQIKTIHGLLAVKCENSFTGKLQKDKNGNLLTTKGDSLTHGFGFCQMKKIAEKYDSDLIFRCTDDGIFTAQTALKIPE